MSAYGFEGDQEDIAVSSLPMTVDLNATQKVAHKPKDAIVHRLPRHIWQDIIAYATATPFDLEGTFLGPFEEYDVRDVETADPHHYYGPTEALVNAQRRVYPTKLALMCVCKDFTELTAPYMYECLLVDRQFWWQNLMKTLRAKNYGVYTRRIEFILGEREVGADMFMAIAALLLCSNVTVVGGFNLGRLITKIPEAFCYRIAHLDTTIEQALAVFAHHPQTMASLRTLELYSSYPGPLPITPSTMKKLHFPQLNWLRVDLRTGQNPDLQIVTRWSMRRSTIRTSNSVGRR